VVCVSRRREQFEQVALACFGKLQGAVTPVIVQPAAPDTVGFRLAHVGGEFPGNEDVEGTLHSFDHAGFAARATGDS
jgi:hypothetical protein